MGLVQPSRSFAMWIADKRLSRLDPIGYLSDGDVLLPVAAIDRCAEFKQGRH